MCACLRARACVCVCEVGGGACACVRAFKHRRNAVSYVNSFDISVQFLLISFQRQPAYEDMELTGLRWPLLMSGLGGLFDLWPLSRLALDTLSMSGLGGLLDV